MKTLKIFFKKTMVLSMLLVSLTALGISAYAEETKEFCEESDLPISENSDEIPNKEIRPFKKCNDLTDENYVVLKRIYEQFEKLKEEFEAFFNDNSDDHCRLGGGGKPDPNAMCRHNRIGIGFMPDYDGFGMCMKEQTTVWEDCKDCRGSSYGETRKCPLCGSEMENGTALENFFKHFSRADDNLSLHHERKHGFVDPVPAQGVDRAESFHDIPIIGMHKSR